MNVDIVFFVLQQDVNLWLGSGPMTSCVLGMNSDHKPQSLHADGAWRPDRSKTSLGGEALVNRQKGRERQPFVNLKTTIFL